MNAKAERIRLDRLLVDRGLAQSRERARALIMAGRAIVGDHRVDKPGTAVHPDAQVRLKGSDIPYVSRGGLKLQAALEHFEIDPAGWCCLDIGASTGGFTDCLLQHGAQCVWTVDVGTNQLHWQVRQDPRVISHEQTDIRQFDPHPLPQWDLIVTDLAFISLRRILPDIQRLRSTHSHVLALVKPQFELEPTQIGKGGIVRDESARQQALAEVRSAFAEAFPTADIRTTPCPVPGTDGNREFLLLCC